ncbi:Hpt domain-containing protein [Gemmobacter sp.]|uniref:Hpt domain-containing protein n=1 Tax=Gemmobacter sp. TaxID=1898957 RepID=UPI002AFF8FA7|nr:Hpt domain-containing protein [Gemmobacter sp.]
MSSESMPVPAQPDDGSLLFSGMPDLIRDQFDRLMVLAGPAYGHELLHRLSLDLQSVQTRLETALPRRDWGDLRAQTHILAALAGSVGAPRLQHMAQSVNRLPDTTEPTLLDRVMLPMLDQLRGLLRFVTERLAEFR